MSDCLFLDGLREKLLPLCDRKFAEFNQRIVNSGKKSIGVRTPELKKIAREYASVPFAYPERTDDFSHEEFLILGFVIAKLPLSDYLRFYPRYVSEADSWAHIDGFVAASKLIARNREVFFDEIQRNVSDSEGFALRYFLVVLLTYYLTDEYAERAVNLVLSASGKGYYNDMAIAWLLSVAFVKKRDLVLPLIEKGIRDDFIHNKTISKITDSFRVSEEDKNYLKSLRR